MMMNQPRICGIRQGGVQSWCGIGYGSVGELDLIDNSFLVYRLNFYSWSKALEHPRRQIGTEKRICKMCERNESFCHLCGLMNGSVTAVKLSEESKDNLKFWDRATVTLDRSFPVDLLTYALTSVYFIIASA